MNIGTIIDAAAAGDPDRAALIVDGRTVSYGELARGRRAVRRRPGRPADVAGERVAVVDVGSLLSIATMLGAARIGAAAALMNPALTPPELRGLVENAGCAEVGVAGEAYADRLLEAGASKALTAANLLIDGSQDDRAAAGRGRRRPRRAGAVHERHDRAAEGDRHHQRAAERANQRSRGTLPGGHAAHGEHDERPVLPRRRRHRPDSATSTRATPMWCSRGSTPESGCAWCRSTG